MLAAPHAGGGRAGKRMMTAADGLRAFGTLLRQHRTAAGLSQEELAERAGLSRRGISDLERGVHGSPHPATVRRLAEALDLDQAQRAALLASAQAATATPLANLTAGDRSVDPNARHNLPVPLTSLVGRAQEITDVHRALARTRLLTLAGPGGVGKTRLALAVAEQALSTYPDGVWFVDLAPLQDPALVVHQVATVLQVHEAPHEELIQTLIRALQPRRLLLVLDNCEQVLAACVDLSSALLRHCPHLRILTTSREVLGIGAEMLRRVPPLRLAPAFAPSTPEQVASSEAAALFVERARMVQPGFAVTAQNAAVVAEVCRRLDGIPLAIELAAARLRLLSLEQLADRLGDHVRLLATRDRTAPPRQQTLQATIDWSYRLLSEPERRLFNRLAVFAAGWTLEAAESIGSGEGIEPGDVLDLLDRLVDKSLVLPEFRDDEPAHYRLLETLRQYGRERLAAAGESAIVRARHAAYFLALAERAEPELRGPQQSGWFARLEREHDNLRAALGWAVREDPPLGLRLVVAVWRFWHSRWYLGEGRSWLEQMLDAPGGQDAPPHLRATALGALGALIRLQGDTDLATLRSSQALALSRTLDDPHGTAAFALNSLGLLAKDRGDLPMATRYFEESLTCRRAAGDRHGLGYSLANLAYAVQLQGDHVRAHRLLEESLAVRRAVGDQLGVMQSLQVLARLARDGPDRQGTVALLRESLSLAWTLGDPRGIATSLEGLAAVAVRDGQAAWAVRLAGAAARVYAAGEFMPPPDDRADREHTLAAARAGLGAEAFRTAWAAGQALTPEQVIVEVLTLLPAPLGGPVASPE